jgi:predicted nucleotidyltransferase
MSIKFIIDQLLKIADILHTDERFLALCVGGSWISNEIDSYSDLDLIIITKEMISNDKSKMIEIAEKLGNLLIGFTGEHVGEPRLLICLYDDPIIHIDLKFLQIEEFNIRIENPEIIWEKDNIVSNLYNKSEPKWPEVDIQWIEDRFWVWIHYVGTKLGRGELLEAISFISFLRSKVLCPLYDIKYNKMPRGARKIEFIINNTDLDKIKKTIPEYSYDSIKETILCCISIYKELRNALFDGKVEKREIVEKASIHYLESINK